MLFRLKSWESRTKQATLNYIQWIGCKDLAAKNVDLETLFIYLYAWKCARENFQVSITWLKKCSSNKIFLSVKEVVVFMSPIKKVSSFYRLIYYLSVSLCACVCVWFKVYFLRLHIYRSKRVKEKFNPAKKTTQQQQTMKTIRPICKDKRFKFAKKKKR